MTLNPGDLTVEERIALLTERYSAESDVYERRWAPGLRAMGNQLLDRLELARVRSVLDAGAGVGALLDDIAARAPEALVVGCDLAHGMLQLAPRHHGLVVGDAIRLPFADGCFDLVTMVFMLFHLPHPVDGLEEARRVLSPGGRIAAATWGDEETWPVMTIWHEELDRHGAGEPSGLHSLHELVDTPEKMAMHLRDAGFADVVTATGTLVREWDLDGFVECATGMTTAKRRFDTLEQRERRRFLEAAIGRIRDLPADAFRSRSEVVFAVGERAR